MTRLTIGSTANAGVRWPNYVNGRLLTADDLSAEHLAAMTRQRWLGSAIGSGIVNGLEVTGSPGSQALLVSPGTGVCPGGTAVHLDAATTLHLTQTLPAAAVTGELFAECGTAGSSTTTPNAGTYLLVTSPTSTFDGNVAVQGSVTAALPTPCASRWEVDGLLFAAIRLDGFTTATSPDNRRNLCAHWCFGSSRLRALAMSMFTDPVPHSPLDALADLTPCDLPLAVFDWDGQGLTFVDLWSARRRTSRPSVTTVLGDVLDDRRAAEGEARFLQFQTQLAAVLATPAGTAVTAAATFPMLPPAGLVPFDPLAAAYRIAPKEFPAQVPTSETPAPQDEAVTAPDAIDGWGRRGGKGQLEALRRVLDRQSAVTSPGGALSARFAELAQRITAVEDKVDALAAQRGDGGARGEQAARERLVRLFGLLLDTQGSGVDLGAFFAGASLRIGIVDAETVDFTVRRSWVDEPVPLDGAALNLWFVTSEGEQEVAPYVLFTTRRRGPRWLQFDVGSIQ